MKSRALRIDNLSVNYSNNKLPVIGGISFDVAKGEALAVLGPSGCGKTTLINAIAGLLDPGEASVSGNIVTSADTKFNIVFQEPRLLPWRNVLGNTTYGLEAKGIQLEDAREKALAALNAVGLSEFADYYPSTLSGGMSQRVNFARAIICEPDILLLDEPFSGLDPLRKKALESKFLQVIKKKNITAIFVTHNIEEAKIIADRILVLSGKPSKVLKIYENKDFITKVIEIEELYK